MKVVGSSKYPVQLPLSFGLGIGIQVYQVDHKKRPSKYL